MSCPIGTDVERAARLIREGGIVAFATETVYGLGANAFDVDAIVRVFAAKVRPLTDPLIVHIAEMRDVHRIASSFPETATRLAERFWPGPLSLVLPKTQDVPDFVTAGLPTVAVRMPDHAQARRLIVLAGVPIAAPSANFFGQVSPTTAAHVHAQLGDQIDYVLDGGPCRVGVESTVLYLAGERPLLLRPGGVTQEEIEGMIGPVAQSRPSEASDARPQLSPGQLSRHYATSTPLTIVPSVSELSASPSTGLLVLQPLSASECFAAVEVLSRQGDLREAAAEFYAALRRLDALELDRIVAVAFPDVGLGRVLNDRLRRAASAT